MSIGDIAIKNAAKTLKARAKQDEEPKVVGNPVSLADWKAEYLKLPEAVEGKPAPVATEIQKYLGEATFTEVKDEKGERVTLLQSEHVNVSIEVAKIKIDEKPYAMEFAAMTARTAYGRLLLCNGVDDITFEGEGEEKSEVPSVTKYFNTAFAQNARNAAAARVRTIVEGPEKALASAAKKLAQVWGVTPEVAAQRIAKMAEA